MTWTYDASDLDNTTASGKLNVVRLLIGDTDTNDQMVQDEEINYFLGQFGDPYGAAVAIAQIQYNRWSREATVRQVGDLRIEAENRAEFWANAISQLKDLKNTVAPPSDMPLVGNDIDADPQFSLGQMDNPRS